MMFAIREEQDVTILEPIGTRLDLEVAKALQDTLERLLASGQRRLVLNLARVDFLDSAGLGAIMAAYRRVDGDGSLQVCGLQPRVRTLFDLTRLSRVIGVHRTEAEAIEAARG